METLHETFHVQNNERKKLNRRSKLFYVSCDYIDVDFSGDGNKTGGFVLNVQSDPLNIMINQNSAAAERERKKRNRKSKLFYVSCEHFDLSNQEVCLSLITFVILSYSSIVYIVMYYPYIVMSYPYTIMSYPYVVMSYPYIVMSYPYVVMSYHYIVMYYPYIVTSYPYIVTSYPYIVVYCPYIYYIPDDEIEIFCLAFS